MVSRLEAGERANNNEKANTMSYIELFYRGEPDCSEATKQAFLNIEDHVRGAHFESKRFKAFVAYAYHLAADKVTIFGNSVKLNKIECAIIFRKRQDEEFRREYEHIENLGRDLKESFIDERNNTDVITAKFDAGNIVTFIKNQLLEDNRLQPKVRKM